MSCRRAHNLLLDTKLSGSVFHFVYTKQNQNKVKIIDNVIDGERNDTLSTFFVTKINSRNELSVQERNS